MTTFNDTICHGCNRWSVLCDLDPTPCDGCDCPDEFPDEWEWWFRLYEEITK